MFNAGAVIGKVILDASDYLANSKAVETKNSSLGDSFKTIAATGLKAFTVIAGAIATAGAASIIAAGKFESYNKSFETLLGSTEKASSIVKDLKSYADQTSLSFEDLAKSSQTMLSFGINVESIMPSLKMLADVSGGNSEKFNSLSLAFSQVMSTGKLMGQDLLQLINQGFNPLQIISEKTGRSMSDLKSDMEKGAISSQMVAEAFKIATSEGGRFYQSMEKQSTTLSGLMSTAGDSIQNLAIAIGNEALPASKQILQSFISLATETAKDKKLIGGIGDAFSAIAKTGLNLLPVIFDLGKSLAPIISGATKLASGIIDFLKPGFDLVSGSISLLSGNTIGLGALFNKLNTTQTDLKKNTDLLKASVEDYKFANDTLTTSTNTLNETEKTTLENRKQLAKYEIATNLDKTITSVNKLTDAQNKQRESIKNVASDIEYYKSQISDFDKKRKSGNISEAEYQVLLTQNSTLTKGATTNYNELNANLAKSIELRQQSFCCLLALELVFLFAFLLLLCNQQFL